MIPVEYYWLTLFVLFGIIGAARSLEKELGVTAIVALSLFALWIGWWKAGQLIVQAAQRAPVGSLRAQEVKALYYGLSIIGIAFISYQGIVLAFPIKLKGFLGSIFGFFVGLVNGYLIIGSIWNVVALAQYFWPQVKIVYPQFSNLHSTVIRFLPISLMQNFSPIPMLFLGMLLLLAIVFK